MAASALHALSCFVGFVLHLPKRNSQEGGGNVVLYRRNARCFKNISCIAIFVRSASINADGAADFDFCCSERAMHAAIGDWLTRSATWSIS